MKLKDLELEALTLPTTERAKLVRTLIGSLGVLSEEDVEALWLDEAARRNAEAAADPDAEMPVEQSLREARQLLG